MTDVGGMSAIEKVLLACRHADVGPVVAAVPTGDPLALYIRKCGIALVVEGDENNVLDRFWHAAVASNCDTFVRITADCVLMWPELIRWVVQEHLENGNDFTTVCREPRRVPDGLDVECISMRMLTKMSCIQDKELCEHVTLDIYRRWDEYSKEYKIDNIDYPLPMGEKYSIDTEEDLERIRAHVAATR